MSNELIFKIYRNEMYNASQAMNNGCQELSLINMQERIAQTGHDDFSSEETKTFLRMACNFWRVVPNKVEEPLLYPVNHSNDPIPVGTINYGAKINLSTNGQLPTGLAITADPKFNDQALDISEYLASIRDQFED
jgi:hypothetical protein